METVINDYIKKEHESTDLILKLDKQLYDAREKIRRLETELDEYKKYFNKIKKITNCLENN